MLIGAQEISLLWIWPFVLLLLCIAVLPLIPATAHWWHRNRNKLMVAVILAVVTLAYYQHRGFGIGHGDHVTEPGWPTVAAVLDHAIVQDFTPFIILLLSLYTISGGIVVRGDLRATPLINTGMLAFGGVIASAIGTTGASMVLIRPLLNSNKERRLVVHTVVFFIFIVSNIGGSLLPIGDPPLFIGYLRGVPFLWTLRLWQEWALVLLPLLVIYYIWDSIVYRREKPADIQRDVRQVQPLRVGGTINFVYLVGVVLAVALLVPGRQLQLGGWFFTPPPFLREAVQLGLMALSLLTTPRGVRKENEFNFVAINEVAALFIGIFITMQVPLEILHANGAWFAEQGFVRPWQYFWATGVLSSFLDNAPTYVVFFATAQELTTHAGPGVLPLVGGGFIREDLLIAVSCGAVFMGACTYIGNGPNFMVKSIAEQAGVRMPSFFGYMAYSGAVLIPLFILVTLVIFRS